MQDNQSCTGPSPIPDDHPLRLLFQNLVLRTFRDTIGLPQREVIVYIANMLAEFAHGDNLYRIQNSQGARLKEVAAMLMEADVALNAPSFDHERAVHKHIGDFTLFWAGVYPESLQARRARNSVDHLIDYVRQGKQSYYIVSTFRYGRYAEDASLFRQLSDEFELCLYGLSLVRREWERLPAAQQPF